jgi:hypothetical protein
MYQLMMIFHSNNYQENADYSRCAACNDEEKDDSG